MNRITLIGNLTADPNKSATQSGISVTSFTIAVNRKGTGVDYFRINAWRNLADNCAKYLSKGRKVAVTGELHARQYQAKDGNTRLSLEVQADEVEFLQLMSPVEEKPKEKPVDEWEDISTNDLPWGD